MGAQGRDPYQTLGIPSSAPDEDVRKAYRRLVQKYHPDHNGGSAESERRFEEVQEAYAKIRELRKAPPRRSAQSPPPPRPHSQAGAAGAPPSPRPTFDPDIEARAEALEGELREAHLARERAREAARQAAAEAARRAAAEAAADADAEPDSAADDARADAWRPGRPSDEELGYIKTDDSFTKILSDARSELSERFSEAQGHPVVRRVSDLIDELDELASKLTGDRHKPKAG
jgi:curved DNA-binding protein CbpA